MYSGPSAYRVPGCGGDQCVVHNVESGGYGAISLKLATAYSVNTVYAQLVLDVGVKETAEMANRLGMTMVNLPTTSEDHHVPFGGRKASGYGPRAQGRQAAEFYTVLKTGYMLA